MNDEAAGEANRFLHGAWGHFREETVLARKKDFQYGCFGYEQKQKPQGQRFKILQPAKGQVACKYKETDETICFRKLLMVGMGISARNGHSGKANIQKKWSNFARNNPDIARKMPCVSCFQNLLLVATPGRGGAHGKAGAIAAGVFPLLEKGISGLTGRKNRAWRSLLGPIYQHHWIKTFFSLNGK